MNTLHLKKGMFLLATLCTLLLSCEDNNSFPVDEDNLLLGNWVYDSYENETTTYRRVSILPKEEYGISFKTNGVYIHRSSGWCGTPPLTFFNIEGSWELDGTHLKIITESWPEDVAWKITSLTQEKLSLERVFTEQEGEYQNLMTLFDEIHNLAYSISCTNTNDWSFTAYGSKSCGESRGYIAYSNEIDTTLFLQKVADYTEAENQYNIKWGIASTCDITPVPTAVVCENGTPVLKYN